MKTITTIVILSLALTTLPAWADCQDDVTAVLTAMRAAGPMCRESKYFFDGEYDHTVTRDFSPPNQVRETPDSKDGTVFSTVLVSGKTDWSTIKNSDMPDLLIYELDGSGWIDETLQFRLPPVPVTECLSAGGELQLIWKSDNEVITAWADATTHLLKTLDSIVKREDGTTDSEEHAKYSSIATFTVSAPQGDVKQESGPEYANISDVDPILPMPPDAV